MSSDRGIRKPVREFRRRASTKGKLAHNTTPPMVFTATVSQDDLCTLPPRSISGDRRPQTADGSKTRKRIHMADLLIDQTPRLPSLSPAQMQKSKTHSEAIGLALGSPTNWQSPNPRSQRPFPEMSVPAGSQPTNTASTAQGVEAEDTSSFQPKRGLFTSLFGRKNSSDTRKTLHKAPPPIPPKILPVIEVRQVIDIDFGQGNKVTTTPTTARPKEATRRPSVGQMFRNPSLGFMQKINKPAAVSANLPVMSKDFLAKTRPHPPPKDFPQRSLDSNSSQISHPSPHLTVDIPDITMERYSVMFGDVLKPRQSLFARRQSNLRYLRADGESKSVSLTNLLRFSNY